MSGLCESVQLKWSGDVDLNNGKLRLDFVSGIGLNDRQGNSILLGEFTSSLSLIKNHVGIFAEVYVNIFLQNLPQ